MFNLKGPSPRLSLSTLNLSGGIFGQKRFDGKMAARKMRAATLAAIRSLLMNIPIAEMGSVKSIRCICSKALVKPTLTVYRMLDELGNGCELKRSISRPHKGPKLFPHFRLIGSDQCSTDNGRPGNLARLSWRVERAWSCKATEF